MKGKYHSTDNSCISRSQLIIRILETQALTYPLFASTEMHGYGAFSFRLCKP